MNRQYPHTSREEIQKVIRGLEEIAEQDLSNATEGEKWLGTLAVGLLGWFRQLDDAERIIEEQQQRIEEMENTLGWVLYPYTGWLEGKKSDT